MSRPANHAVRDAVTFILKQAAEHTPEFVPSYTTLAEMLNELGIKSATGQQWTAVKLQQALINWGTPRNSFWPKDEAVWDGRGCNINDVFSRYLGPNQREALEPAAERRSIAPDQTAEEFDRDAGLELPEGY